MYYLWMGVGDQKQDSASHNFWLNYLLANHEGIRIRARLVVQFWQNCNLSKLQFSPKFWKLEFWQIEVLRKMQFWLENRNFNCNSPVKIATSNSIAIFKIVVTKCNLNFENWNFAEIGILHSKLQFWRCNQTGPKSVNILTFIKHWIYKLKK
jgi:hypothetical protein